MAAIMTIPTARMFARSSWKTRARISSTSALNPLVPGSQRISEAEELRRLVPVLKRLKDRVTVPLSVDTYKSGVARKAMEFGVAIINDPSALTFDRDLARVVAQCDAGFILNHMRGTPETWAKLPPLKDVAGTVAADLGSLCTSGYAIRRVPRANRHRSGTGLR
jgi:dihydropteroate synthase